MVSSKFLQWVKWQWGCAHRSPLSPSLACKKRHKKIYKEVAKTKETSEEKEPGALCCPLPRSSPKSTHKMAEFANTSKCHAVHSIHRWKCYQLRQETIKSAEKQYEKLRSKSWHLACLPGYPLAPKPTMDSPRAATCFPPQLLELNIFLEK